MIINSLSMKDFQCYYGEHEDNHFDFTSGLNLIIGANGAGKSKLYDAFYWVLNDQIFLSDRREFVFTKSYTHKLVSDKAKRECSIGETVSAEVTIRATSAYDKEYRVTRIFRVMKTGGNEWECGSKSMLIIEEMNIVHWSPINASEHNKILERIIPSSIKPYMWFQGEQVDGLLNLSDKATLTTVINIISNIQNYDDLISITEKGHKKSAAALRKAEAKQIKDQTQSKRLTDQIDELTKSVSSEENTISSIEKNIAIAIDKIDSLINKLDDAEARSETKAELVKLTEQSEGDKKKLEDRYNGFHKKMFTDSWVLIHARSVFDEYSEQYSIFNNKYMQALSASRSQEMRLPINVPQPIYVNSMLHDEKCFVCGRGAAKGSDAYNHIEGLLSRNEEEEEELFVNDCSGFFKRLYDNGVGYARLIDNIRGSIASEFRTISSLTDRLKDAARKISEINSKFSNLLEDNASEGVARSYRVHESNLNSYRSELYASNQRLQQKKESLEKTEADLKNLVDGPIPKNKTRSEEIFRKLAGIAKHARSSVFNELIHELQDSANELFQSMTQNNNSITGKIVLKELSHGHYIPEIIASDGIAMSSSNDSNIVLVKLSLIMAIIRSRGKSATNYSFISDAPTSKMDAEYSFGFYNTLSNNFQQSIVTTYDFNDESEWDKLKRFNIGKAYYLQSIYEGGDRNDRADLQILRREIQL
ncbi:MAG: AAA family ATPase [Candidatus Marinimicrobia bacterium]|jgi:DNA sulfur modification protein DndD|nr:AAA family ATPase [Candidatus Neomarinimicrobiota bacterium]